MTVNSSNNSANDDWLLIGLIVGAHGLKGHVKVVPESDFPERFTEPGKRWLRKLGASSPEPIELISGRFLDGKNQYLLKFAQVDTRDQADTLRKAQLLVPQSDRLALAPGEFHVGDLIGLSVVLQADRTLIGTVTNVFTTGHDMLEVSRPAPGTSASSMETSGATAVAEGISIAASDSAQGDGPQGAKPMEPGPLPLAASASEPPAAAGPNRAKAIQKLRRQERRKNRARKGPRPLLIPFVEEIVPVVDLSAGVIEITPPPGLIDL